MKISLHLEKDGQEMEEIIQKKEPNYKPPKKGKELVFTILLI